MTIDRRIAWRSSLGIAGIAAQVALASAAIVMLALAPPRQGAMVLLPLDGISQGAMARLALAHDGRVMGQGRWPNSLIVWGDRAAIVGPMTRHGVLVLAAGSLLCGGVAASLARRDTDSK